MYANIVQMFYIAKYIPTLGFLWVSGYLYIKENKI